MAPTPSWDLNLISNFFISIKGTYPLGSTPTPIISIYTVSYTSPSGNRNTPDLVYILLVFLQPGHNYHRFFYQVMFSLERSPQSGHTDRPVDLLLEYRWEFKCKKHFTYNKVNVVPLYQNQVNTDQFAILIITKLSNSCISKIQQKPECGTAYVKATSSNNT